MFDACIRYHMIFSDVITRKSHGNSTLAAYDNLVIIYGVM